jgi:hypothetical protein
MKRMSDGRCVCRQPRWKQQQQRRDDHERGHDCDPETEPVAETCGGPQQRAKHGENVAEKWNGHIRVVEHRLTAYELEVGHHTKCQDALQHEDVPELRHDAWRQTFEPRGSQPQQSS